MGVNCIWNSKSLYWVHFSSKNKVVFASMTNTDRSVKVSKRPFDYLIQMNSADVIIAKKRVLGKNSFEAIRLSCHHHYMRQYACALVPMDNIHMLSNEDLAYQGM